MQEEMYREIIMDLHENPHNFGKLENPNIEKTGFNASCGDKITLYAKILDHPGDITQSVISEITFDGVGCAIHTAAASLITDAVKGKTIQEVQNISKDDMFDMLVVPISPGRIKCALLSWDTMQELVKAVIENKNNGENNSET
ncbi:MAG: iron-sulfur cluster assembly scaffold protein [Candidatus Woesearchaeota archaeon]